MSFAAQMIEDFIDSYDCENPTDFEGFEQDYVSGRITPQDCLPPHAASPNEDR